MLQPFQRLITGILALVLSLSLLAAAGCHATAQDVVPAKPAALVPLVFVHGIKGAELVEGAAADGGGKDEVRWLTLSGALGITTPDLALEPRFVDGVQPFGRLHPGRVMGSLKIIPYVLEVDIYGKWMRSAKGLGRPFYPFSYDWRRDLTETAATLGKFLEALKVRHGVAPQVVAHSMGGLVTLAVLNRRPELMSSVVFAGVPFAGGIGFLPDLHSGTADALNYKILSPEVLWTFPSTYALFPPKDEGSLLDAGRQPIAVDFYAAESWCAMKLGPCWAGQLGKEWRSYFDEALGRARHFRDILADVPTQGLPPVVVVAGNGQPTLNQAVQDGPRSVKGWDFDAAPRLLGDGRVTYAHAQPPAGLPHRLVTTEAEHTQMLLEPALLNAIKELGGP